MICKKCNGKGTYPTSCRTLLEYCWTCQGTGSLTKPLPTVEERLDALEKKVKLLERMVAKLRTPKQEGVIYKGSGVFTVK